MGLGSWVLVWVLGLGSWVLGLGSWGLGLAIGAPRRHRRAGLALRPEGIALPLFDDCMLGATRGRCRTRSAAHKPDTMERMFPCTWIPGQIAREQLHGVPSAVSASHTQNKTRGIRHPYLALPHGGHYRTFVRLCPSVSTCPVLCDLPWDPGAAKEAIAEIAADALNNFGMIGFGLRTLSMTGLRMVTAASTSVQPALFWALFPDAFQFARRRGDMLCISRGNTWSGPEKADETTRVHRCSRRRLRMAACSARAATGDTGNRVPQRQVGKRRCKPCSGVPSRPR